MQIEIVTVVSLIYFLFVSTTAASVDVGIQNAIFSTTAASVDVGIQNAIFLPKTLNVYIPAQNVSNNQEIIWMKPTNLNGSYDVMLVMFFKNLSEKGEVILSIGKGNTPMKNYRASFETLDDLPELVIHQPIKIDPQDDVKIFYKGDNKLLIKRVPHSFIMLTKTNI